MSAKLSSPSRTLQLTARDLAIVDMVHAYSGCTPDQIHERFWPRGSAYSACYRRLAFLTDARYLAAQRLPSLTGVGSGKRLFTIGPTGRVLLAERHGIPVVLIRHHDAVTPLFVQHHVAIGDFRIALELAAAQLHDVHVTNWIDEAILRRSPMRVREAAQEGRERTITLVPDGAFTLVQRGRQQLCLLEMDMGTIAPKRLQTKIRGYLLRQTDRPIPIFFVTPTAGRAERVHGMVTVEARKIGVSPSAFFLSPQDRVTRDTVLKAPVWDQVGVEGRQAIVRSRDMSAPHDAGEERSG
jgi:hypothetical protein